jgi:predicted TIM-barrel fold metal-dependent hydrolase
MLIDSNAYLGPWPFAPIAVRTAPQLSAHLAAHGIRRALVSHLGAVFLPDPMPANRELFAAVRRTPSLVPVPIINPALANWREQLAICQAAVPGLTAVKILPNYHNYKLRASRLTDFMGALSEAKLKLVLNVRLEDERHKYFALRIKGVPVADVAAFLKRFPKHHVLLTGIYKPELEKLVPEHTNFSADIAFCEWYTTLVSLLEKISARRLLLGTCTPLLSTRGEVAKLNFAKIPASAKTLIGSTNARRFFGL